MQTARFDGPDYVPARDDSRLNDQLSRVKGLMKDGMWRSLKLIAELTGDPEASVSAQLRHLRKPRFGSNTVERKYVGNGLYEYKLTLNEGTCS